LIDLSAANIFHANNNIPSKKIAGAGARRKWAEGGRGRALDRGVAALVTVLFWMALFSSSSGDRRNNEKNG
jgi:hypothetical protein